ncbi:hypothetical protein OIU77_018495 [Salix suchowensis]|uniref:Secreted protein n=1 Tax=Salix suchowensis TaxID=1278906 RepID=A0ABQ9CG04_9ROSI|nr:hypothetical protein OIU77_018495 [Salix suchowensis]
MVRFRRTMSLAPGVVLLTIIARGGPRLILIAVDAVASQGAGVEFYLFTFTLLFFSRKKNGFDCHT